VRMPKLATRSVRFLAVPLLVTGVACVAGPVTAAAARTGSADPAASSSITGGLNAVAATSASNAWAVGSAGSGETLIERWNGRTWTRVPSPSPANSSLTGVAATSASNAWAVGSAGSGKALIERWNGRTWTRVPSPGGRLTGVAATSASNAWAVGGALIERWNGKAWKQVPGAAPANSYLTSVAATSASNAWAVGCDTGCFSTGFRTLILHWNGKAWKRVPSPALSTGGWLGGVTVTSATSAWAVGTAAGCGCSTGDSLILHWNGTAWKRVPSPTPHLGAQLYHVTATSAGSAWAVGFGGCGCGVGVDKTLIERWNGKVWTQVPSPSLAGDASLSGIAVTSASSAWAVGVTDSGKTLILRWNGTAWKLG
jgi:hypothetical protein